MIRGVSRTLTVVALALVLLDAAGLVVLLLPKTPATSSNHLIPCADTQVDTGNVVAVDSVCMEEPANPGGPTIDLTLRNAASIPIVGLSATLSLQGKSGFYSMWLISNATPLMPGKSATQPVDFIGGSFEGSQRYPLQIWGGLQNGTDFNFTVYVHIGAG